ncbi:MAG TPA: shikimate kinase [Firmicutes bacterium]|nr:shikimate kinase [Bacillota bacterium]
MQNIILTGFMGTGKTTVGRLLAEKLKLPFVDVDAAIEAREGTSINDIFAQKGEAYFRRLETEVLREILAQDGQVIAAGGGILLKEENREMLRRRGKLVCLTASPAVIFQRLQSKKDRPLLSASPSVMKERIEQLLAARESLYRQVAIQVNTDFKEPEEVAAAIAALINETGI